MQCTSRHIGEPYQRKYNELLFIVAIIIPFCSVFIIIIIPCALRNATLRCDLFAALRYTRPLTKAEFFNKPAEI
jgi:hypothetical protein